MTDVEQPGGRREELLAAALAGDLSSEEAIEFDRLRAADPTLDRELASFGVVLDRLGGLVRWDEAEPSAQLRSRVLGLAAAEEAAPPSRRGRLALAVGAAAACLVLGVVAGSAFQAAGERPVTGPPGTLGAVEAIAFDERASGVRLDGSLVAHTWGTETILRGTGFELGASYDLVLVTGEGERLASGSFLGSSAELDCEMNAAVLRDAVAAVEITDAAGTVVASAALPAVTG
ncbi:hypothetical protein [Rathayibacter tanaceti]|uniref:Anti-sigma-K factor rskA n=2 Tax=Rathayibacter tanaceti TaxID=1671680 RepID=A0A166HA72_9MICO|nr:hypothetical protein [Rathayibacter tanaceti]KZX20232.1 hypothetical protein ACH61_02661 [Rathayibacter tanaceti]QHC56542.1 hypothetical protein GSU10_13490 [Rathayibacter tanaceti]TCO36756.1 hypothetical protein EV639_106159 [Rathayibacter tanaceti]